MKKDKNILIIDDDERNIFALKAVLQARGFTCFSGTGAKEGLDLLALNNSIDVALIDMMMPDMDGYEMISVIRSNPSLRQMPLVAVTAQAMLGDKEKCLAAGADDYVSKPINVDKLVQILEPYFS